MSLRICSWTLVQLRPFSSAFQTRPAQTAIVFTSQRLQRLCAEFDFAAPTAIQVDFTRERLAARGALLRAVQCWQNPG
jgi:hypothetical protein